MNSKSQEEKVKSPLKLKIEEMFGLDLRSLALFRICFALVIIYYISTHPDNIKAFYTDFGVLPRSAINTPYTFLTAYFISGNFMFQLFLLFVTGCFAVLMLIGYRTKLVTFITWYLITSLHLRNHMLLSAGDRFLHIMLFISIFLPWGACYSIDCALNSSTKKAPKCVFSAATIAYYLQFIFVYFFAALLKSGKEWHFEASAVYYTLCVDEIGTSIGKYLLNFPEFLKFLTHYTIFIEQFGVLFLISPIFTIPVRTIALLGYWCLILGFIFTLQLAHFSTFCFVAGIPFVPGFIWEKLCQILKTSQRLSLKIYYDANNQYTEKFLRIFKVFFLIENTQLIPLTEKSFALSEDKLKYSWFVENDKDEKCFDFEAINIVCRSSPILGPLSPILRFEPVKSLFRLIYEECPKSEEVNYIMSKWLVYRPLNTLVSVPESALILFLTFCMLLWNIRTVDLKFKFPEELNYFVKFFNLEQRWGMFAPRPYVDDGWFVIPGKLKDGTWVDLFRDGAKLDFKKPSGNIPFHKNFRWYAYSINLRNKRYPEQLPNYVKYLCRDWNSKHGREKRLERLIVYFMREDTLLNYEKPKVRKILLGKHNCFSQPTNKMNTMKIKNSK